MSEPRLPSPPFPMSMYNTPFATEMALRSNKARWAKSCYLYLSLSWEVHMTMQIKLAATLVSSFVFGCIGFGALHAQTKIRQPFGLPRHWRCLIKPHF